MKREFLQNFKVGDQLLSKEVIDAIMAENGRDIEAAKKPYADYDHIKQQLEAAQTTIKGLQDQDIDDARKAAREWEEKYNQAVKDHEAKLANMDFDRKIEAAITTAKGKNAKAIKALLDVETLNVQALSNMDAMVAHFYVDSGEAKFAERYPNSSISVSSLGGEGGGIIGMPIDVTYGGARQLGSVTKASNGTVTFSAATV